MTNEEIKAAEKQATRDVWVLAIKWFLFVVGIIVAGMLAGEPIGSWLIDNPGVFLLALAGVSVAVMDTLQHHFSVSKFHKWKFDPQFWNAEISWKNKYIDGDFLKGEKKWLGIIPMPVVFTDGWHLFKGIHTLLLVFAIALITNSQVSGTWYFAAAIYYTAYKLPFTVFYSLLKNKKK